MIDLLTYQGNCPYCNSYYLIHLIGIEEITCGECGKKFTKREAEEITGIVIVPYPNPLRRN